IDIYIEEESSHWIKVQTIKREKVAPPYYVTDGRATKFVMRLITCNQVPAIVLGHKGFKAEFRRSKCAGCNQVRIGEDAHPSNRSISTNCVIDPEQCVYIYSAG